MTLVLGFALDGGGLPYSQPGNWLIFRMGGMAMTFELFIGLVTCVATVIATVIAALSYFHNKDE